MRSSVSVTVETCTGHRLLNYIGKCMHLHGHNYQWTLTLVGMVDPATGFLVDFARVKRSLREVTDPFDHALVLRHDDPVIPLLRGTEQRLVVLSHNPTAENLSACVRDLLQPLFPDLYVSVSLRETEHCVAEAPYTVSPSGVEVMPHVQ